MLEFSGHGHRDRKVRRTNQRYIHAFHRKQGLPDLLLIEELLYLVQVFLSYPVGRVDLLAKFGPADHVFICKQTVCKRKSEAH